MLFLALADGTDSLADDVDLVTDLYPRLSTMDDEATEGVLALHGGSVFVNASSVTLVNEDNSLMHSIEDLANLGGINVEQIELQKLKAGMIKASFMVEGLGPAGFAIEDRKRSDAAPLLAEMSRIAMAKGAGSYLVVHEGSSEGDTFILANEKTAGLLRELVGAEPVARS